MMGTKNRKGELSFLMMMVIGVILLLAVIILILTLKDNAFGWLDFMKGGLGG
jgi:succinate dehydrogenase hydrophobic anchor subunit